MNIAILEGIDRVCALGVIKTFCETLDGLVWNDRNCAYKFLVVDGQLVIGPINDHSELYAAFKMRAESIDDARSKIHTISMEQYGRCNYSVTAAGQISADGWVTGWKSTAFRLETPPEMRGEIERAIAELYQKGALKLR
ncbi:MAG: hypothetical protein WC802_02485 [Patescibacteria group bacterium]